MPQFDTIVKGGTVVDGTRVPRYQGDIGIKNGKIAEIGKLNNNDATKVVDADGLVVAPGFVDLHTHYDAQLHWDPYLSISSWHGVTSLTIGNCGSASLRCAKKMPTAPCWPCRAPRRSRWSRCGCR